MFKRKVKLQWAKAAAVKKLVTTLVDGWEAKKLSEADVVARATIVAADAATGELLLEGNNIYVVQLLKAFEREGIEIPKPGDKPDETYDKYL